MSKIQEVIDYIKEDGEFSDCVEQIELANEAEREFEELKKEIAKLQAAQQGVQPTPRGRGDSARSRVRKNKKSAPAKSG